MPEREIVGLIPAAGLARRISPLPCSKELLPVEFRDTGDMNFSSPKVVSFYLLEKMRRANATKIFIILRKGKWDIPAYFGNGDSVGVSLAYLMMGLPYGVPYTINQAFHFIRDSMVIFGFPDVIFQPEDAFIQLLQKQNESGSDVVLGIFPTHSNHKGDTVTLGRNGVLERIQVNPKSVNTAHTWIIAAWTPQFTHFLNAHIALRQSSARKSQTDASDFNELFMGDVIQAALEKGLSTEIVHFPEGHFLDIGHPENYAKIISLDLKALE